MRRLFQALRLPPIEKCRIYRLGRGIGLYRPWKTSTIRRFPGMLQKLSFAAAAKMNGKSERAAHCIAVKVTALRVYHAAVGVTGFRIDRNAAVQKIVYAGDRSACEKIDTIAGIDPTICAQPQTDVGIDS